MSLLQRYHFLSAPLVFPFPRCFSYPSVKNSEGVVLWTHDIGSGLVAPAAAAADSEGSSSNVPKNDAGDDVSTVVQVLSTFISVRRLARGGTCVSAQMFAEERWIDETVGLRRGVKL